jgi:hypothetical protein
MDSRLEHPPPPHAQVEPPGPSSNRNVRFLDRPLQVQAPPRARLSAPTMLHLLRFTGGVLARWEPLAEEFMLGQ